MLVRKRVHDAVNIGHSGENLLAHLVHGGLHTSTVILRKKLQRDIARRLPGLVELGDRGLHGLEVGKGAPLPCGVDVGGEDAVPRLGEGGELVADEAVEGGASALEDSQTLDAARHGDARIAAGDGFNGALLLAITQETVRMGLPIDVHPCPAMRDDTDMGSMDMRITVDEVGRHGGGEELGRGHGVLLGEDVDCVLDGVCGDDDAVVGAGVGGGDVALEEAADCHLGDGLCVGGRVAVDFADADVVLAVAGGGDVRHDG